MATVVAICIGMAAGGVLVAAAGVLELLCEAYIRFRRSETYAILCETLHVWRASL